MEKIGGVDMKKNAFTLTEVLGVLIILAFLALLVSPFVSKAVKNNKQKLYDIQIKEIERATKDYATKNIDVLPEEGKITILTLGQVKKGGSLPKEVRNPITKELFPDDLKIEIRNSRNQYTYKVITENTEGVQQ